jgi:hypothetical protein
LRFEHSPELLHLECRRAQSGHSIAILTMVRCERAADRHVPDSDPVLYSEAVDYDLFRNVVEERFLTATAFDTVRQKPNSMDFHSHPPSQFAPCTAACSLGREHDVLNSSSARGLRSS